MDERASLLADAKPTHGDKRSTGKDAIPKSRRSQRRRRKNDAMMIARWKGMMDGADEARSSATGQN